MHFGVSIVNMDKDDFKEAMSLILIYGIVIAFYAVMIYVAWHFIAKFW